MVQIDDVVISLDLFEKKFICDIPKCKGCCCVEGESGAPLKDEEATLIEELYPIIEPYLVEGAKAEIAEQGKWVIDEDNDKVTPIINGAECVYAYFEEDGTCKCAIEKAYLDGKINFKKPISCHLYPIRMQQYRTYRGMNYHYWPICAPARDLGNVVGLPIYKFLKEPIIREFGTAFYDEMEDVEKALREIGRIK